jgi:hypothetical protein
MLRKPLQVLPPVPLQALQKMLSPLVRVLLMPPKPLRVPLLMLRKKRLSQRNNPDGSFPRKKAPEGAFFLMRCIKGQPES